MTSQSPRIYTYKITFEEVPYYYYGVHKEKKFDEYYMGSPCTHKWCWELYTPKKQILEIFEFSDEGWLKAQEVEKRLIKPVYNTDKWCLNENCRGKLSLSSCSNGGKMGGNKIVELGIGIHSFTKEQKSEIGKKSGSKAGKIGGKKTYELGVGVFAYTKEERIEVCKKAGKIGGIKSYELGVGVHSLTKEQMSENGRKAGKIGGKIASKNTNSQRWECCETGYISTAAGVVSYQKGREIDTSKKNRKRVS
jgi:hypothetical protein